jgi:predicted ATP-grasp superfamily ATP-dependent carboligase
MTETVLIAALSARALAQSARRAGFVPLVVDAFGDEDTRAAAAASAVLPEAIAGGFRLGPLAAALDRLTADSGKTPFGLVLGAGFEDRPKLAAALAARYRLLGSGAETIRAAKDPGTLFPILTDLGIAHPAWGAAAPAASSDWISKRVGGSGGLHIRSLAGGAAAGSGRYAQHLVAGRTVSALGIFGARDCAFAMSRQWTSPAPGQPYRYGGAAGSLALDPDLEARIIGIALDVAKALELVGLASFDFIVPADGVPVLIEVNPRPGATVDIFDDASGSLFAMHVAAALGETLGAFLPRWAPPVARAAAYLYADEGSATVPAVAWPDWALDRPGAGTRVRKGAPVATVTADGPDLAEAEATLRDRLEAIADLVYGREKSHNITGKETP